MQRYRVFTVVVATAAVLVGAPDARAQAATAGTIRIRCRGCASTSRDSSRVRREQLLLKFDSLRNEFDHQRSETERDRLAAEMHKTVMAIQKSFDDAPFRASALAAARAGTEVAAEAMRMTPEIAIAVQSGFSKEPRGYLGVSFDGPNTEELRRNGERVIRFLDYPRIALVEPSSPAERAGILEGDTLLAFNGNDVRDREISLTKLLVPDHRIVMRVRRDGNRKEFRVTIDDAPGYVMSRMPMPAMAPVSPMAVRAYSGEEFPRRRMAIAPPAMPAFPPGIGSMWIFNDAVGGAKLETISEGLGRALGTKAGVLVLRTLPGTPAYESGLRDGDVILSVAGKQVSNVGELRGALMDGDRDSGVKFAILREHKQREVVLRW